MRDRQTYIETDRQTDRRTDRQTDRQTREIKTGIQTTTLSRRMQSREYSLSKKEMTTILHEDFYCLFDVSGVIAPFFKKSIGKERTLTEMKIYTVKTLHRTRLTGTKNNSHYKLQTLY